MGEYLDNPELRRVFLVSDREDGSARQRVASVVERTTRFNFYKITISQGIVIDPRHPDEATVFALVVGPRELEDLRHQLRVALGDRVEETDIEPEVVTQLADIGHVEACPPLPAARIDIPRDAMALLRNVDAAVPVEPADAPQRRGPNRRRHPFRRPPSRSGAGPTRIARWRRDPTPRSWSSSGLPGLIRVDRPRPPAADDAASIGSDVTVACRPGI